MIEPESLEKLGREIQGRVSADRSLLEELRSQMRALRGATRRIQPRATTAISLVATDGGDNQIQFDPFLIQLVRVVDSSNNEYCLEAITPTTDVEVLSRSQFDESGVPLTPLGELMAYLGVRDLPALSHMIRPPRDGRPISPSWVATYRSLVEWSILFKIIRSKDFATDTLIVFDGLLRSKLFAESHFTKMMAGIREAIEQKRKDQRRRIYLVGIAKHSAVLIRYRLAMALECVLNCDYPAYVEIPPWIERATYSWREWAPGEEEAGDRESASIRFVAGKLFFVKFGSGRHDPIWPVDVFEPQANEAQTILGFLLADAVEGFPIAHYPRCLQKAHENAALVDFDFEVMQDQVFAGLRSILGDMSPILDSFRLQDADPSRRRYG